MKDAALQARRWFRIGIGTDEVGDVRIATEDELGQYEAAEAAQAKTGYGLAISDLRDRLSRAGVPVELHMYPRAYHGFYRATNARVTRQAEHDNREALRHFLHG